VAAYARKGQDQATATELADAVADSLVWITKQISDGGLPTKMQPLLAHAQHAAEAADRRGSEYAAGLLNNLGYHFDSVAGYDDAHALYERALRIDEAAFSPDHPKVAICVNNLGTLAQDQADLPAARAFLERALRIFEQTLGADHPSTRTVRSNLAGVLAAGAQPPQRPSLMARLRALLGGR
jgi:tetratricopeptide (TPR) repeat protein